MNLTKKIVLVLLTISMLLTSIPFSVSAEGDIWDAYCDSLPPWNDINNYIDYNNEDGHKTEGYRPGKITVFMTEEFMSTHSAPVPSDFVNPKDNIYLDDFIIDIIHEDYHAYNEFEITLSGFDDEPFTSNTVIYINAYIMTLDDFMYVRNTEKKNIVESVRANYVCAKNPDLPYSTSWEEYDNYYYYKNEDWHKKSGYSTDCIIVEFSESFRNFVSDNIEPDEMGFHMLDSSVFSSVFPEMQDKIISVKSGDRDWRWGAVYFENWNDCCTDYTKEHIDEYVEVLKYLYNHPVVVSVTPNAILTGYWDEPETPPLLGDVDGNDKVNSKDVLMMRKALGGVYTLNEKEKLSADVDGDGELTPKDVLAVRKYLGGVIEELPLNG